MITFVYYSNCNCLLVNSLDWYVMISDKIIHTVLIILYTLVMGIGASTKPRRHDGKYTIWEPTLLGRKCSYYHLKHCVVTKINTTVALENKLIKSWPLISNVSSRTFTRVQYKLQKCPMLGNLQLLKNQHWPVLALKPLKPRDSDDI